jgi:hypothetical protein
MLLDTASLFIFTMALLPLMAYAQQPQQQPQQDPAILAVFKDTNNNNQQQNFNNGEGRDVELQRMVSFTI